jgi:polyphosphate glucokinase
MEILGVDIGGSGIKVARVDSIKGEMLSERVRVATPQPSTPSAVAGAFSEIVRELSWAGPIGCGFPAVVQGGVVRTAANVSKKWIGTNAEELFSSATGCRTLVVNDADAAGLAEMRFGAGRGRNGVVMMITIGTGLGTALFTEGQLLPNTELGHLYVKGMKAEHYASDALRKDKGLSWKKWGKRFTRVLCEYEALFWPDLFVLGGGASNKFEKFGQYLTVKAEVVPAQMLNEAGIVGAALAAM